MSAVTSGRVFISYRREEASGQAGRLRDRLADRFGDDQIFMDVDTIAPGADFAQASTKAVRTCQVLLVVIGPRWLTMTDQNGRRRLEDSRDMVHQEIATALECGIHVIPILVQGAHMPRPHELPERLVELASRNAFNVRDESFRSDADRLLAAITPILRPTDVAPLPTQVQVLRHDADVNGVAFSLDGKLVATASDDKTARLWEVASDQDRARVITHHSVVFGATFSPNGKLLATASGDGTARLWEVASGQEHARVRHDGVVYGVAFSPDGELLATASGDGTARLWDVGSGQERAQVRHDGVVWGVAFGRDGALLATASGDRTARLWEVASQQQRPKIIHHHAVYSVAFSPDGDLVATASYGRTAQVWELAGGQERTRVTHDHAAMHADYSPEVPVRPKNRVSRVIFSPDGQLLATASDDKTARVWEVASGLERAQVTHDEGVRDVAFSPDGRLLATASYDDSARIWALMR